MTMMACKPGSIVVLLVLVMVLVMLSLSNGAINVPDCEPPQGYSWDDSESFVKGDYKYSIFWKVQQQRRRQQEAAASEHLNGSITLLLTVASSSSASYSTNTISWVGFGLSEVGHMVGSDIVTVRYDASTDTAIVEDRWVDWSPSEVDLPTPGAYPQLDVHNDWTLMCQSSTSSSFSTIITRALDTGDGQDRVFRGGMLPVIYAWGEAFGYHGGANRGSGLVTFFGPTTSKFFAAPLDADGRIDLVFLSREIQNSGNNSESNSSDTNNNNNINNSSSSNSGWKIKAIKTQYICQAYDLSAYGDRHIVAIEPLSFKTEARAYVHHLVVYACGHSKDIPQLKLARFNFDKAFPCRSKNERDRGLSPMPFAACSIIYVGAEHAMSLPPGAGFKLGASPTANQIIVVEAHLHNPNLDSNTYVTNMVRLHTASTFRAHDAGVLTIGDAPISLPRNNIVYNIDDKIDEIDGYKRVIGGKIAAGTSTSVLETTCSPQCTARFKEPLTVFSSVLHAHAYGHKLWTTKISFLNPHAKEVVDMREFWHGPVDGESQRLVSSFVIEPGDQLNLHCTYDTSMHKNKSVSFGDTSYEEMCMNFLFYFPAQSEIKFCSHYDGQNMCGNNRVDPLITTPQPMPDGSITHPLSIKAFGASPLSLKLVPSSSSAHTFLFANVSVTIVITSLCSIVALFATTKIYSIFVKKQQGTAVHVSSSSSSPSLSSSVSLILDASDDTDVYASLCELAPLADHNDDDHEA